jgi:glycosyltransferase involved in cell wall biosynthesis
MEAFAKQTDPGLVEVVVVDDASDDDTWPALSELAGTAPFPLKTLRMTENGGPATARNTGWRVTRAEVVAFTDDDCVPQPGWLSALAGRFADADIVQGRTVADPAQIPRRGPFSHVVEFDKPDGYFETCNIAYRRRLLEDTDGFDEGFRFGPDHHRRAGPIFGEDTDLAWRALERGARACFEPGAVVFHDVSPSSYRSRLARVRRAGGIPPLVRRHPGMRNVMYARWFYVSYHPPALLAALGTALVLGRRSRWWLRLIGLVFWLPYADNRMNRYPLWTRRRYQVALLPAALFADMTEVGVIVRSAARERTFLL